MQPRVPPARQPLGQVVTPAYYDRSHACARSRKSSGIRSRGAPAKLAVSTRTSETLRFASERSTSRLDEARASDAVTTASSEARPATWPSSASTAATAAPPRFRCGEQVERLPPVGLARVHPLQLATARS